MARKRSQGARGSNSPASWGLWGAAACLIALVGWIFYELRDRGPAHPRPVPAASERLALKERPAPPTPKSEPAPVVNKFELKTNLITSSPPVRPPEPAPLTNTQIAREAPPEPVLPSGLTPSAERILAAQAALAMQGISPGSMDGRLGGQTRSALRAFQIKHGLPQTSALDSPTMARLTPPEPLLIEWEVTREDLARLMPLNKTWLGKSLQSRLDYETILEMAAERSMAHPALIEKLNPGVAWNAVTPGSRIRLPAVTPPAPVRRAAIVRIFLLERAMRVFDADDHLLAHFPCSIARRVDKRPLGDLRIVTIARNPNYTFDPAIFRESKEAQSLGRKLLLHPGPNNPVGTVWIGLDLPGYGIHGTPRPEEVGRTESHGCFRLANWNAEFLAKLSWPGLPVRVEP